MKDEPLEVQRQDHHRYQDPDPQDGVRCQASKETKEQKASAWTLRAAEGDDGRRRERTAEPHVHGVRRMDRRKVVREDGSDGGTLSEAKKKVSLSGERYWKLDAREQPDAQVMRGTMGKMREAVMPSGTLRCVVLQEERSRRVSNPNALTCATILVGSLATHYERKGTVKARAALIATFIARIIQTKGQLPASDNHYRREKGQKTYGDPPAHAHGPEPRLAQAVRLRDSDDAADASQRTHRPGSEEQTLKEPESA